MSEGVLTIRINSGEVGKDAEYEVEQEVKANDI